MRPSSRTLSGLCSVAFTATQYALLTSLAAIALRTVGGLSGFLAEAPRLDALLRSGDVCGPVPPCC